jgi:hypothetical protein
MTASRRIRRQGLATVTSLIALCAPGVAADVPGPARALREGTPPITVRCSGPLPLEPGALNRAQRFVENVFAHAGVPLVWIWCASEESGGCNSPEGPSDIRMRIVRRSQRVELSTGSLAGGRALRPSDRERAGTIEMFDDRLDELRKEGVPSDLALGVIAAHEIGHMLLPPGHSAFGIMKKRMVGTDWLRARQGTLQFTLDQSHFIRRQLEAQLQAGAGRALAPGGGFGLLATQR